MTVRASGPLSGKNFESTLSSCSEKWTKVKIYIESCTVARGLAGWCGFGMVMRKWSGV
jgi:hypothetical protein